MISMHGRIDVHHHVATDNNPLYELPGPRIWWSEAEALKMMDKTTSRWRCRHTPAGSRRAPRRSRP